MVVQYILGDAGFTSSTVVVDVLVTRALLFRVYIRAPFLWKLPKKEAYLSHHGNPRV